MENNKINKTLLLITSPLFYLISRLFPNLNLKISKKNRLTILIICSLFVFVFALFKIIN
jgi:hypothetical protein